MSLLEKVILDKNSSVLGKSSDGRPLSLLITVHCLAKNELNNSAFFLKSAANLFPQNKDGIIGVFLLLKNIFKIDQYAFGV